MPFMTYNEDRHFPQKLQLFLRETPKKIKIIFLIYRVLPSNNSVMQESK